MTQRYHCRVAVVTGGTTGIGRGIVERLVGEGASVVTCARHASESPLPDGVTFIEADITDESSVSGLFEAVVERHGHVDVFANAGGANIGPRVGCHQSRERTTADIGRGARAHTRAQSKS